MIECFDHFFSCSVLFFITQISAHDVDNELIISWYVNPLQMKFIHRILTDKIFHSISGIFSEHVQRGREVEFSFFIFSSTRNGKIIEARFRGFISFGGFEMVCCRARCCLSSFLSFYVSYILAWTKCSSLHQELTSLRTS